MRALLALLLVLLALVLGAQRALVLWAQLAQVELVERAGRASSTVPLRHPRVVHPSRIDKVGCVFALPSMSLPRPPPTRTHHHSTPPPDLYP